MGDEMSVVDMEELVKHFNRRLHIRQELGKILIDKGVQIYNTAYIHAIEDVISYLEGLHNRGGE